VTESNVDPSAHLRIARPSGDLAAAERFYVAGLGLHVLFRGDGGPGEHDLLIVGWPTAAWHLELVVAGPVDDGLVARLESCGGTRVSQGAYWDRWGVTLVDPDGYRLVLSTRSWSNAS
jgi:catechol 2,3-dioxygenase-like lactoylglutathione lyase family enzyme